MTLLQNLIHGFQPPSDSYVAPELVVVHLPRLTEAEAAPLEEALQPVLAELPGSDSTGIDEEGAEASLYLATENAVELTRAVLPVLLQHPLSRDASITIVTRVSGLPSQSDSMRLPLDPSDAVHTYLQQIEADRLTLLTNTQTRGAKHA